MVQKTLSLNWDELTLPDDWLGLAFALFDRRIKLGHVYEWFQRRQLYDNRYHYSYKALLGDKRALPCNPTFLYPILKLMARIGMVVAYCPGNGHGDDVIFCTHELWSYFVGCDFSVESMRLPTDHPLILGPGSIDCVKEPIVGRY